MKYSNLYTDFVLYFTGSASAYSGILLRMDNICSGIRQCNSQVGIILLYVLYKIPSIGLCKAINIILMWYYYLALGTIYYDVRYT